MMSISEKQLLKSERSAGNFSIQTVKSVATDSSPRLVEVDFEASSISGSVGSVTSKSNRHWTQHTSFTTRS